jgi:hypothetical protein
LFALAADTKPAMSSARELLVFSATMVMSKVTLLV